MGGPAAGRSQPMGGQGLGQPINAQNSSWSSGPMNSQLRGSQPMRAAQGAQKPADSILGKNYIFL